MLSSLAHLQGSNKTPQTRTPQGLNVEGSSSKRGTVSALLSDEAKGLSVSSEVRKLVLSARVLGKCSLEKCERV